MGKYFMGSTLLSNVERAMTQIPGGASHSGEFIGLCRFRYSARDPTCRSCLDRAGDPAGTGIAPWGLAALYLLTAREALWRQTEPALRGSTVVLSSMCAKGLGVQDYALYQTAKALRRKEIQVSPGELADRRLVSDETLRLIVNAVLIAMCGQTVIGKELKQQ